MCCPPSEHRFRHAGRDIGPRVLSTALPNACAPQVISEGDHLRAGTRPAIAIAPLPFTLYSLTRIYSMEYIKSMESAFEVIAEPNRRAILSLLASSQQSVGEIERQLHMPQPTVSKHLRVLRDAGFVESTVDAQRRLYRLKPGPLREIDAWRLIPPVLVRSRGCSPTPPGPSGSDRRLTKRKTRGRSRDPNRGCEKGEPK